MDVPSHGEVLDEIDAFLARHGMAPSRLGREALGEAQFVSQVRKGRHPNLLTLLKLLDFMEGRDKLASDSGGTPPVGRSHRLNAVVR